MFWKLYLIAAIAPALLPAQALVEYGLAAAAAGNAGAASRNAAGGIGGALSNLTRTLNAGQPAATSTAPRTSTAGVSATQTAPAPAKPEVVYEDAAGIQPQMERAELIRRFGPPAMSITGGPDSESMTYDSKAGTVEVEMRNGKVATVQSKAKPKQSAVVVLN